MVLIQLVTLHGCPEAKCEGCDAAEEMLHQVVRLCGMPLPEHESGSSGESYLADGRTVEAVHLSCDDEDGLHLDPEKAPFLLIDGQLVMEGAALDPEELARAVMKALYPHGLADLRP